MTGSAAAVNRPAEWELTSLFDDEAPAETIADSSFFDVASIPHLPALATFGHFEILGRLARGGMAEVYLAREQMGDVSRHLVLKVVSQKYAGDPYFQQMFLEEGRVALRLFHRNICHVYECGEVEGTAFLAMEWIPGPSMKALLERSRSGGIPAAVAAWIAAQTASALQYVHGAHGLDGRPLGIIHRDVSPHNIMLSWDGAVKLLDFGIAKTTRAGRTSASGLLVGKSGYISIEQAQGRALDARSDVFALGVCLYELLTGAPLYRRGRRLDTLIALFSEPTPSLRTVNPSVPVALDAIVQKAVARSPQDRFQTAAAFEQALLGWMSEAGERVSERRLAVLLGTVFTEEERFPLPEGSSKLTGSFSPVTAEVTIPVVTPERASVDASAGYADLAVATPVPAVTPGARRLLLALALFSWTILIMVALRALAGVLGGT